MINLNKFYSFAQSFKNTNKMPVLFVGHGSPMNAIEENEFVLGWKNIATTIPTPNAIICISAHWFTNGTMVTAMDIPKTIYDFGGFPKQLYEVKYPAKGSPQLAIETQNILAPTSVNLDTSWGLDHGAWSVIKHLYPKADIPIIQLSIDYTKPAQYHFDLAKKLHSLRYKGILIIGSGNIIHNLSLIDFKNMHKDNYGYDWAIEANHFFNTQLLKRNFEALINYTLQPKAIQLAVPTPDHFLPLIYSLGLIKNEDELTIFNDKLLAGSLSMTSIKIY